MKTLIPISNLAWILETIRNRILDFVVEIETELPKVVKTEPDTPSSSEQTINYYFNKCVLHKAGQFDVDTQNYSEDLNMSDQFTNNLQGAIIGNVANQVNDSATQEANQTIYQSVEHKNLAEAAKEIQQLLTQLDKDNPSATEAQQITYLNDETTPSFKRRAAGAFRAAGESAIDEFILESKYLKVAKAAIMGWIDPS